jgi:hypothetical protein
VHPKLAQALARHSTITLTMDRHTHTVLGEQAEALAALPDLSGKADRQQQRATGTDDNRIKAINAVESLVSGLVFYQTSERSQSTPAGTQELKTHSTAPHASATKKGASGKASRALASIRPTRRAGLEPATFGSVDRCSVQLS